MGALMFLPFVGGFLVAVTVIWYIYLFARFVLYVIQSFGLLRIAKKENYRHPAIVWIPGAAHYVLGRYCLNRWQSVLYAIASAIAVVVLLGIWSIYNEVLFCLAEVFSAAYFVADMMVMHKFYQKVYKKPELFTILTVCSLGLLKPVFIYMTRVRKITQVEL